MHFVGCPIGPSVIGADDDTTTLPTTSLASTGLQPPACQTSLENSSNCPPDSTLPTLFRPPPIVRTAAGAPLSGPALLLSRSIHAGMFMFHIGLPPRSNCNESAGRPSVLPQRRGVLVGVDCAHDPTTLVSNRPLTSLQRSAVSSRQMSTLNPNSPAILGLWLYTVYI